MVDRGKSRGSLYRLFTQFSVLMLFGVLLLLFVYFPFLSDLTHSGKPSGRVAVESRDAVSPDHHGENIICIFTGRWKFLRVNFPYLYRDLRQNGGVIDRVYYIMIQYDSDTHDKLVNLTQAANRLLGDEVFQFRHLNHEGDSTNRPKGIFAEFYYIIYDEIARQPRNKYIKMDDDIVYVHPDAFRNLIEQQNSSKCFIHFGNIVSNWRCNYIHDQMGVFSANEVNPRHLKFQFSSHARCGWRSPECASLALSAFLYHHQNDTLEKYLFDGLYLTSERARFSINIMLLDINLIDLKNMLRSGPIGKSDEEWWTVTYSAKVKNPNCIVGQAFFVHFSYFVTITQMTKQGFLAKFDAIAQTLASDILPPELLHLVDRQKPDNITK